jgi:hypothetical protein
MEIFLFIFKIIIFYKPAPNFFNNFFFFLNFGKAEFLIKKKLILYYVYYFIYNCFIALYCALLKIRVKDFTY